MKNLNQFTDSELYSICKKWGREALSALRRFAGMSRDQMNRVLQLNKRFSTLPILREVLINADVSINKLAGIASAATF